MPDSGAVYQPTTVGYSYEGGGDPNENVNIRNGFSRIIFRHKVSTRKWLEWVLISVAICATVAGITTVIVNLLASDSSNPQIVHQDGKNSSSSMDTGTKVEEKVVETVGRGSVAVGASITLLGLIMGMVWAWMHFFRRGGKSQRSGMSRASGQMLGGLNPSTDLLVGSTSQYGPVLTEVPTQMTKQVVTDGQTIPMSDQEEETHTLMPNSTPNPTNNLANQLAG